MVNTLTDGDHFGEISMLYGCNTTATVIANSYCTCAKINQKEFKVLTQRY